MTCAQRGEKGFKASESSRLMLIMNIIKNGANIWKQFVTVFFFFSSAHIREMEAGAQPKSFWIIKNFFGVKSILLHCSLCWRINAVERNAVWKVKAEDEFGAFIYLFRPFHSLICSYGDYIKPLCPG